MKRALGVAGIACVVGVLAVAASTATTVSCSVDASHIFQARLYEQQIKCLDPYTAIDLVSGDDTGGGCPPVCLRNGASYYVTQQCAPYPPLFIVPDAGDPDPTCTDALAAFTRGDRCDLEGGVIHADGGDAGDAAAPDAATLDAGDAEAPDASDAAEVGAPD